MIFEQLVLDRSLAFENQEVHNGRVLHVLRWILTMCRLSEDGLLFVCFVIHGNYSGFLLVSVVVASSIYLTYLYG